MHTYAEPAVPSGARRRIVSEQLARARGCPPFPASRRCSPHHDAAGTAPPSARRPTDAPRLNPARHCSWYVGHAHAADAPADPDASFLHPLPHALPCLPQSLLIPPSARSVAAWNLDQSRGRPPEPTTLRSTWWGRVVEPGTGARNAGCDRTKPPATRSPDERVGNAPIWRVQAHSPLTRRRTRSTYLAAGSCRRHRAYRVVQSHQERRLPPSTSASGTSFRRVASCDVAGRRLIPIKDLERWLTGEASRPMP
jgi:hypothetical protein